MGEATVSLGLDPSGLVAGARVATAALGAIRTAGARLPQSMGPVQGAIRSTAAGYQGLARTGTASMHEQARASMSTAGVMRHAGGRAGEAFGRAQAAGVRRATPQLLAAIDAAARQAQARLNSIRPATIRMPSVAAPRDAHGRFLAPAGATGPRDSSGRYTRGAGFGSTYTPAPPTPGAFFGAHRERIESAVRGPHAPQTPGAFFASHRRRTGQPQPAAGFSAPVVAPGSGGAGAPPPQQPGGTRTSGAGGGGSSGGGSRGGGADDFGMARGIRGVWMMSSMGGALRRGVHGLDQFNDRVVDVGSSLQDTRSELRAVMTDEHALPGMTRQETIDELQRRARDTATGRTELGDRIGVTENQYTEALRGLAASGFKGTDLVAMAETSIPFAIASELRDPKQAANYLSIASTMWLDRSKIRAAAPEDRMQVAVQEQTRIADMLAKAQDTYRTPEGFRPIGEALVRFAPQAARADEGQALSLIGTLIDAGRTGANAGFAAMRIYRDVDRGFSRMGMTVPLQEDGDIDMTRALGMLRSAGITNEQMNQAFGRRTAAPIQQVVSLDETGWDKFIAGIGDFDGTMWENTREHLDNLSQATARYQARVAGLQANMAQGSIAVRQFGLNVGAKLAQALTPGSEDSAFWKAAGGAMEVAGAIGRPLTGALDMGIGLYAADQLFGGRIQQRFADRHSQRQEARAARRTQRGATGLFRSMTRGIASSRRGIAGMFTLMGRGAIRMGAMVGTELAAGLAGRAAAGVAGNAAAAAGGALSPATMAIAAGAVSIVASGAVLLAAAKVSEQLVDPAGEAGEKFALWTRNLIRSLTGKDPLSQNPNEVTVPDEGLLKRAFFPAYPEVGPREPAAEPGSVPAAQQPGAAPQQAPMAAPSGDQGMLDRYQSARASGRGLVGSVAAGLGFGKTMADGMAAGTPELESAAAGMAQKVADYTPQSDAKVGPLSDLTARGMAIPATLALGVLEAEPVLRGAVSGVLSRLGLPTPAPAPGALGGDMEIAPIPGAPAPTVAPIGLPGVEVPAPEVQAPGAVLAPIPDVQFPGAIPVPAPEFLQPGGAPLPIPAPEVGAPGAVPAPEVQAPGAVPAPEFGAPGAVPAPEVQAPGAVPAPEFGAPGAVPAPEVQAPGAVPAPEVGAPGAVPAPEVGAPGAVPAPDVRRRARSRRRVGAPGAVPAPDVLAPGAIPAPEVGAPGAVPAPDVLAPGAIPAPEVGAPGAVPAPDVLAPGAIPAPEVGAPGAVPAPDVLAPGAIPAPEVGAPGAVPAPDVLAPGAIPAPEVGAPGAVPAPDVLAPGAIPAPEVGAPGAVPAPEVGAPGAVPVPAPEFLQPGGAPLPIPAPGAAHGPSTIDPQGAPTAAPLGLLGVEVPTDDSEAAGGAVAPEVSAVSGDVGMLALSTTLRTVIATERQLIEALARLRHEQSRARGAAGAPAPPNTAQLPPADVQDFDVAGDLIAGRLA